MPVGRQTDDRLLRDEALFEHIEIEELTEETKEENPYRLLRIRGTASKGGIVNRNNRLYPTEVLAKAVEKIQPKIRQGKFVGELDHPWDGGSLRSIAMKFTRVWMEGDEMKFEADVIPTPSGELLATLLRSGIGVGMSTRGYGSTKEENINGRLVRVIQDDFELVGIDAVLEESNPAGKISSFESKGGRIMDLETLKKEYPDLVTQLEAEVKARIEKDLEAQFEQKVAQAIEAKTEEIKTQVRDEVLQSEEIVKLRTALDGVVEAIKPLMPAPSKEEADEALKAELEQVKAESAKKDEQIAQLESAKAEAERQLAEHKTREALMAKIEEKVKGHRFEAQLRSRLMENCTDPEKVDEMFTKEVQFIESLVGAAVSAPTGQGQAGTDDDNDKQKLDEAKERQRRLAGITEGGESK